MDTYSWNWGAIASIASALITGIVAIYISRKWRHQKYREILSNEAASVLIAIQDYLEKIIELHSLIMNRESDVSHKKEVENLKEAARKLRDRSFLFNELITDGDDLVLKIGEISVKFYYEARDLDNLTKQEVIISSASRSLVDRFNRELTIPRQRVKTYYLYKKKV